MKLMPFINRRDWLIYHYSLLGLKPDSLLVLLEIDFLNQENRPYNEADLALKCSMEQSDLNLILNDLINNKILKIEMVNGRIKLDIDAIFDTDKLEVKHELLSQFEQDFGRPFTSHECQDLNRLYLNYDFNTIMYGLKQAILNNKLNMKYIEAVCYEINKERNNL